MICRCWVGACSRCGRAAHRRPLVRLSLLPLAHSHPARRSTLCRLGDCNAIVHRPAEAATVRTTELAFHRYVYGAYSAASRFFFSFFVLVLFSRSFAVIIQVSPRRRFSLTLRFLSFTRLPLPCFLLCQLRAKPRSPWRLPPSFNPHAPPLPVSPLAPSSHLLLVQPAVFFLFFSNFLLPRQGLVPRGLGGEWCKRPALAVRGRLQFHTTRERWPWEGVLNHTTCAIQLLCSDGPVNIDLELTPLTQSPC
ncbi:hypothetical protein B0H12DRAFT_1107337 [Mycena haematopus]|nr:hypothetical protein B0H12DRAFT_1107337 [Mycena haematopus]